MTDAVPVPTPEQREELARALREAVKPLVAWRDEHADIEDFGEDVHHSDRMREVAEALDAMFDLYDSAVRAMEDEEPYLDEAP